MSFSEYITLKGIKTNNLRNIDIQIPKNHITTITGVSGSGKSSLAFDTLYKEGQFRYIESLSSYLRQFFNLGEKPDIDSTSGLSPAIAIEQNKRIGNSRSSVGTLTEIDDYLRLLFAKLGKPYCYQCGTPIMAHSVDTILQSVLTKHEERKIYLLQEIGRYTDKSDFLKFVKRNRNKMERSDGFTRFLVCFESGCVEYFYLESPNIPDKYFPLQVYGIYDRITANAENEDRLKEDIVKLLNESNKFGIYEQLDSETVQDSLSMKIGKDVYATDHNITRYTDKIFCPTCNITYPELTTQSFSPNRQEGACLTCHGLGEILDVALEKLIDTTAMLSRAIIPRSDSSYGQQILSKLATKYGYKDSDKRQSLPDRFQKIVIEGDGETLKIGAGGKYQTMYYKGIKDVLTSQYNKGILSVDFQSMLGLKPCDECHGAKLKKESLHVFLELPVSLLPSPKKKKKSDPILLPTPQRLNLAEIQTMPISQIIIFLSTYLQSTTQPLILVERILHPLLERAQTIEHLGLGYLNLNRSIDSLSGGEIQRLRLAKQLGNKLTGIIYVLDEPTIGLDDREITKVITAIKSLQTMGNTIVVVEHNDQFIRNSDWVIEIGPGAGDFGGHVVFSGPYADFLTSDCLTAQYMRGDIAVDVQFFHELKEQYLTLHGAHQHNLKHIDVSVRLGGFTIITGPSGSGKTTLMYHTLFRFLDERIKYIQGQIRLNLMKKGLSRTDVLSKTVIRKEEYESLEQLALQQFFLELKVTDVTGRHHVQNVIYIDQSSIGKTPRSCPATFIGVFDNIRNLFAGTSDSKLLGFNNSYFSFNSSKGACPECEGYGQKKIELQFLPDTYVPCTLCKGKRYKSEILSIQRHGKNISEVLEMYVSDALVLFADMDFIAHELQLMCDIGLGYLRMGQSAHTLSGGESQRLKLVKHLLKQYKGHSIYFLDEPTVGLHPSDIQKLLLVIKEFLLRGDTILMIEHDKSLLKFADDVITLDNGSLL